MGEQNVKANTDETTHQAFMKSLLTEVNALERMLDTGLIETGVRRIGAEQEMFLIDKAHKPALKAMERTSPATASSIPPRCHNFAC